jgi:hypothetical protein
MTSVYLGRSIHGASGWSPIFEGKGRGAARSGCPFAGAVLTAALTSSAAPISPAV